MDSNCKFHQVGINASLRSSLSALSGLLRVCHKKHASEVSQSLGQKLSMDLRLPTLSSLLRGQLSRTLSSVSSGQKECRLPIGVSCRELGFFFIFFSRVGICYLWEDQFNQR